MNQLPFLAAIKDVTPVGLPAGVSVSLLTLDFERGRLDELLALLPGDERARCLRYRRPADGIRFAVTRAALRRLLAERCGRPPEDIALTIDAFGKPRLVGGEAPFFNLSHSGNFALIALSAQRAVGVDIEAVSPALDREPLYAGFTPQERRHCRAQADADADADADAQAFFRIWSGKEAVLKALGLGIATHLPSVSVIPVLPGHYAVSLHMAAAAVQAWPVPAPPGCVAALAVLA